MLQNLADLARECGSSIKDPSRQQADIAKAILSHSDGLVRPWFHTDLKGLNIISTPAGIKMRFPFEGDDFWQTIEGLHEEALVDEEEYQTSLSY